MSTVTPERGNMTQNEMIKKHLQTYGSITPGAALEEYGCFRLSARIADLKAQGMKIVTVIESKKNRFGKKVRYARYKYERQQ